jgi:hypothetical protein
MYQGPIKLPEQKLQVTPNAKDLLEIDRMMLANKNCKQVLPLLPDHLKGATVLEVGNWLLVDNFNNWAYLELDIDIDLEIWKKEIQDINHYFIAHPDQPYQTLYQSCTFHGLGPKHTLHYEDYVEDDVDESSLPYHWTEIADQCPTITKFWKDFPIEKWSRVRPLKLGASGYIGVHRDMSVEQSLFWNILTMGVAVNMSIIHPEGCETWFEGFGKVPWKEGKFFLHNISKLHWVTNFTDQDRIHMIPMGNIGNRVEEFCKLVVKSYLENTDQDLNLVNFDI